MRWTCRPTRSATPRTARGRSPGFCSLGIAILLGVSLAPIRAWARNIGLAVEGCDGCHGGGRKPMVRVTVDPMQPAPGTAALVTVHIQRANGNVGGFYMSSAKIGTFAAITGQQ